MTKLIQISPLDNVAVALHPVAKGEEFKLHNPYVQDIINNKLPLTIGGGIGQSRLCMFFLKKIHIGEVQASIWDEKTIKELASKNINLL